jgi:hypothetical protein
MDISLIAFVKLGQARSKFNQIQPNRAKPAQREPKKTGGASYTLVSASRFLRTFVASNINIQVKACPPTRAPVTAGQIAL